MKVSVIVPTLNEEKYISDNIKGFLECTFDKSDMEVIYVDGVSTDKTCEIIKSFQGEYSFIKLCVNEKRYTPYALNIGIKEALGDYVIIMGAHSKMGSMYIQELVDSIEKLNCEAVGGVIETDIKNRTPKTVAIKNVLTNKFGVGNAAYRINEDDNTVREVDTAGFLCYKKQTLMQVGLYNEKLIRNQDIEINRRISQNGGKIFLVPTAKISYYCRENFKSLAQNNYANGMWNLLTVYYTKNFKSLSLRHFIPLIFILSLLLPTLLSFVWEPFGLIALASFVMYNLLIFTQSCKMNSIETNVLEMIKAFYTLHLSYGLGSFVGIFKVLKLMLTRE